MHSQSHTIRLGDVSLNTHITYNPAFDEPRPAVLIAPSFTGLRDRYIELTHMVAEWGYVGIAIDVYGDGANSDNRDECMALMQPFVDDRAMLRQRLQAHFAMTQDLDFVDPEQIAIMGFCFGGTCALDLARCGAPLRGAVSIHGGFTIPTDLPCQIDPKTHLLILHGYKDALCPPEGITDFAKECDSYGDINWQWLFYGQDKHAFTDKVCSEMLPSECQYNEETTRHCWRSVKLFLEDVFD